MADPVSPDGRFVIRWYRTRESASYMDAEDHFEVVVRNVATEQIVKTWTSSEYADRSGERSTGVQSARFSEDGRFAIATFHGGGPEERFPLPEVDDVERKATARCPLLTFGDGRWRVEWKIVREDAQTTEFEITASEFKNGVETGRRTFSRVETRGADGKVTATGVRKVHVAAGMVIAKHESGGESYCGFAPVSRKKAE